MGLEGREGRAEEREREKEKSESERARRRKRQRGKKDPTKGFSVQPVDFGEINQDGIVTRYGGLGSTGKNSRTMEN